MIKERVVEIVKYIVYTLASKKYKELVESDIEKLLKEEDVKRAIEEYGRILTVPPEEAFINLDIYVINDKKWSIDFDLWVDNNKSDLTLGCTIIDDNGVYKYSIDNIHVL